MESNVHLCHSFQCYQTSLPPRVLHHSPLYKAPDAVQSPRPRLFVSRHSVPPRSFRPYLQDVRSTCPPGDELLHLISSVVLAPQDCLGKYFARAHGSTLIMPIKQTRLRSRKPSQPRRVDLDKDHSFKKPKFFRKHSSAADHPQ